MSEEARPAATMPPFLSSRRVRLFASLMLVSLAQLATAVAVAGMVGELFRHLLTDEPVTNGPILVLTIAIFATAFGEFARRRLTEALGLDYAKSVRMALFEQLLRRPVRGPKPRSKGSQLLPFVGDLTALRLWWADGIARGSSASLIAVGIIGWLFAINITLGLWITGLTLLALGAMSAIARPYFAATSEQRSKRGAMTALISDRIGTAHTVMGMGGLRRECNHIGRRIDQMNAASLKRANWSGTLRGVIAAYPLAIVMALLRLAFGETTLPPHEIAGLLTLIGMLAASVADLGRAVELAIPAHISGKRLQGRLKEIEPLVFAPATGTTKAAPLVAINALTIDTDGTAFHGVLDKGDILAIDGVAGGEPGQLIEMLAGLQPPRTGEVCISGRPASGLGQRQRRQWVGIVAPWAGLLQNSLADNLLYRMRRGSGESELSSLMKTLGLAHLADREGDPLPLRLRDEGSSLPPADLAGIRLLRAIIGKPRLLLLDRASHDLTHAQLQGLVEIVSAWRGAVVMTGERPELQALCNRRWSINETEVREEEISRDTTASRNLRTVERA